MLAVLSAQVYEMYDGHMDGGWWWVMGIGWLIFLAVVVGVAVVVLRHYGGRAEPARTGLQVLDERFARGEIDENEYRQRRDALRT